MATSTNERLRRIERLLFGVHRKLDSLLRAQNLEIDLELEQMFNLDKMNASIAKIRDIASSVKAAYDGVIAQRDAAVAELAAVKADDAADQEKLTAAEANLAAAEAMLETLKSIAEGTPVVLPPDTGGSTAGNTEPTQP